MGFGFPQLNSAILHVAHIAAIEDEAAFPELDQDLGELKRHYHDYLRRAYADARAALDEERIPQARTRGLAA